MKSFFRHVGLVLSALGPIIITIHRFSYPDLTEVRWIMRFWYIPLVAVLVVWLGMFLYAKGTEVPKTHWVSILKCGPKCQISDCHCREAHGIPVLVTGYPPLHEGCDCYAVMDDK